MKFQNILPLIIVWSSLSQSVSAVNEKTEVQQIRQIEESVTFDMPQDFRETKKVFFSALFGGSSHVHWVISILNELSSRGHNASFITKSNYIRFSRGYPHIKTIAIGEEKAISDTKVEKEDDVMANFREQTQLDEAATLYEVLFSLFEEDYFKILNVIKQEPYDVAICDSFNWACQEAAHKLNIPTIITSSMPQSDDAAAPYINSVLTDFRVPTTRFMGFWERVEIKLIRPIQFFWRTYSILFKQNQILKSSGSDPVWRLNARWKHSVKMYNTAFGIQLGRPIGPLVEFVGPILKTKIPKLTPELENYLNTHTQVAYIGFGQNAVFNKKDMKLLLTGLLEAYEHDEIDGFIWSIRDFRKNFPNFITTQSNTTYDINELFDKQEDLLFLNWAPQMAILTHPSTSLNINHGGSASIYESLYAGLKMVVYPVFGDQPTAAFNAEKRGYGLGATSVMPQERMTEIIRTVARDEDGKFQETANRYKSLIQIRSKHGVIKGADLVEEVLFMNENGKITHRRDVKHDISFLKATNLDIYLFALACVSGTLYYSYYFIYFIYLKYTGKTKQKTA